MRSMRKYFRGSGRVLAFVFIASVIWLLFDMAALRLSLNDVNSQLLKELVIKERAAVRQQATGRTKVVKGFKHPVQRVDLELDNDNQSPFRVVNKVAEVYRKRPKKDPVLTEREVKPAERGGSPGSQNGKTAVEYKQDFVAPVTPKLEVHLETKAPVKKTVDIVHVTKPGEKIVKSNDSHKKEIRPLVPSNSTKVPPGIQREKHVAPSTSNTKVDKLKGDIQKPKENIIIISKHKDKSKDALEPEKQDVQIKDKVVLDVQIKDKVVLDVQMKDKIVLEPTVKPAKKDVGEKKMVLEADKQMVKGGLGGVDNVAPPTTKPKMAQPAKVIITGELGVMNNTLPLKLPQVTVKAVVKAELGAVNSTLLLAAKPELPQATVKANGTTVLKTGVHNVHKAGVHKVLPLDVTQAPRDGHAVGQFGFAAIVPSDKEEAVRARWNEGHFNVYVSEQIPVDRAIPDTRPQTCSDSMVHDDLPTTSVIFCFVDEVWSTLLRSVHSVLNRSPPHLLREIILVDDFSSKDYLKKQLDDYMSQFPKVRIIRLKEREGLIRARLAGAAIAKGEVLTFLDSHVECNVGWLEPLLERVYLDRKKVACPVIEVISDKDMSYVLVDNFQRGIFKWPLVFGWSTLSEEHIKKNNMKDTDPIRCPVMAGGLFSIDKKYFYELGSYDPGLDVWGGENMEISFKIWMCGGEIEIIPCSRVGHIFRGENPYKFPKDRQKTVERNLARVAEVWLDEYKELFYGHGYHHLLGADIGNLTQQIQLRKQLKCQTFSWYLENVYPDMDAPLVKAEGLVFNRGVRKCLALQEGSLSFEICDLSKQSQHFNYTWMRLVRQQDLCVAPQGKEAPSLALQPCDNTKPSLRWLHKASSGLGEHLVAEHIPKRVCLEAGLKGDSVRLSACEPSSAFQKWQFTHYYAQ